MPIKIGFLRRKPKIVNIQPGDISKLQLQQEHERRVKEAEKKRRLLSEREFRKAGVGLGRSVAQFGQAGLRREDPFTQEQMALKSMFGDGEKIWGWKNEPVEINNDLNPRQRGDFGTAELFGF